jgi:hypothetical protein
MVQLESNAKEFVERFEKLAEKARYLLSSQVLADSNKHARMDTGEMIFSSQRASDLPKGLLVWDTPYAKRVYFTGTPSTDRNPDAELMWVHVARDRYSKDWLAMFEQLAKNEVLK